MRLSEISPFTPIFTRELRSLARRKRTYLLRTAYLGLFTLILLGTWANLRMFQAESLNAISAIQMQNEMGQSLFAVFSMFNVILLGTIGPLLTCTTINSERLGNTLPVLLMTPLSSWQIVIGKLSSRLMAAAMLLVISMPVLAVIRLLGGVELWQIGHSILLAGALVFCGASVGLFFSAITTRAYASILFTYGFFSVLYIVLPIMLVVVGSAWFPSIMNGPGFIKWHPFSAALSIVNLEDEFAFWPAWVIQLMLGLTAILTTPLMIRRRLTLKRELASHTTRAGPAPVARAAPADVPINSVLTDPTPLAMSSIPALEYASTATPIASRDVGDNPVLWRELRRDFFLRKGKIRWIVLASVGLMFSLLYTSQWQLLVRQEYPHIAAFCLAQAALLLFIATISASSISTEKESDTWQLIVSTPLSGRQIVYGKIFGMLSRLMLPACLVLLHTIIFTILGAISWIGSIVTLLTLAGFALPWIPIGLFLSLRLNSTTTAVVVTLVLQLLTYVGLLAVLSLTSKLLRLDDDIIGFALIVEPFYYIAESLYRSFDFSGTIRLYNISHVRVSYATWLVIFQLVWIVHLTLAWLGIEAIIRNFDRIVSRAKTS